MQGGIIVVGSINLDMVVCSPRIPGPGENVCGAGFTMVPGGKGANQAVAAGRLGSGVFFLGRVGADYFGDFLVENLQVAGIDAGLVARSPDRQTGVALIVVEKDTGTNTIVVDPGANMSLATGDLDVLESCYPKAHSVLFQLEIPIDVVNEGARRARERGLVTIVDAGPPRGPQGLELERFDIVSPNGNELAALTGEHVNDVSSAREASRELLARGVKSVVVKMGEAGSVLVTPEGAWHFPPYKVKAVDTTAAGDAFTAGLAAAIGSGMDLPSAILFANAAGAVAVTVLGAQPSMPTRLQVEELMASQRLEGRAI